MTLLSKKAELWSVQFLFPSLFVSFWADLCDWLLGFWINALINDDDDDFDDNNNNDYYYLLFLTRYDTMQLRLA
jgi:hypothetical protein